MFDVSDRFARSVVRSHDVAVICEIVDETGSYVIATLDVIGGSVTIDAGQKTRQQCTLTLQDPTGNLVPDEVHDMLQPYSGFYFRLWRGIAWPDGTSEVVPLGTFAPWAPRITDSGDSLEISVTGYDRSKIISSSRWVQVFNIDSGTNTATAIKNLLDDRMPGLRYNFEPTATTVPLTTLGMDTNNDPWDDATKIAEADGMELFFDARDNVVLRTIPDLSIDPIVHEFNDGDQCTVTSFVRNNDASQLYTGVIVTGEGSEVTPLVRAEVWRTDTDLRIPYFYTSSLITTLDQANSTATSLLRRVGLAEVSVDLRIVPDPRFEAGDVVRVVRERSKLNDVFMINSMTIPLDSSSEMAISTAQRRANVTV